MANVWADRVALRGKTVRLEKVSVKRVTPLTVDPNMPWRAHVCAELRDTPTATNYLTACQTVIGADSASGCSARDCVSDKLGTYVSFRGELQSNNQLTFSIAPGMANPAIP